MVTPSRTPVSISCRLTQSCSVCGEQPIFGGDGFNRRPQRRVLAAVLLHHAHCTLADFRGKLVRLVSWLHFLKGWSLLKTRGGSLTIRDTKFGKSRYVPLHSTTQRALQRYAARRDRCCHDPETPSFFVSDRGTRLTEWCVRWTFVKLSHEIGLRGAGDSRGPRLHDLRHRLAINTLLRWYQRGVDVERHLPQLSTYLGHAHITDTYWYLTATPQLLRYALRQVEHSKQGQRP